jgi:hypothetical protein
LAGHSIELSDCLFRIIRKMIEFVLLQLEQKRSPTQSSTDAIAFFRFSHKAIAFPSHSAQVEAIAASPSYFEEI